jgi:hypothetical protein
MIGETAARRLPMTLFAKTARTAAMVVSMVGFMYGISGAGPCPFVSTVQIKWDNGTIIRHYLYHNPGTMTMLTDSNLATYDLTGSQAFLNASKGDVGYVGCGIAVAQSALSYFGINLTRAQLQGYIPSHKVGSNIYVRPSDIASGIRNALYKFAGVTYCQTEGRGVHVVIETGKTPADIANHLAAGYPVIALVDGGTHYVLAVAHLDQGNTFRVVNSDHGGDNFMGGPSTIDLNFNTGSDIAQWFQGDQNYAHGMIIHFDPIPITPNKCPKGQKDCSMDTRPNHVPHCVDKKAYCCGGEGCDQPCQRGPNGKAVCP